MRKTTKHWKKVTPKEFAQLKALLDAGVSRSKVAAVSGRSSNVVWMVSKSFNFKNYLENTKKLYQKRSTTAKKTSPVARLSELELLTEILQTLRSIESKMGSDGHFHYEVTGRNPQPSVTARI